MSTAPDPRPAASEPEDPYGAMLRWSAIPSAAAGGVVIAVASVIEGTPGFLGSVLAVAVVLAFFSASLVVMRATAKSNPQSVLAAAVLTYVTKVGVLGLFLVLTRDADWASRPAFAAALLVTAAVWLGFETWAYTRQRVLIFGSTDAQDAGTR